MAATRPLNSSHCRTGVDTTGATPTSAACGASGLAAAALLQPGEAIAIAAARPLRTEDRWVQGWVKCVRAVMGTDIAAFEPIRRARIVPTVGFALPHSGFRRGDRPSPAPHPPLLRTLRIPGMRVPSRCPRSGRRLLQAIGLQHKLR